MKHKIEIIDRFPGRGLVQAVCSCGQYRSAPGSDTTARKAGVSHVSMTEFNAKRKRN